MKEIADNENYTSQEVADALRISISLVRHWVMKKKIPVIRIGKKVFVKGATIQKIYDSGITYDGMDQG